MKKFTGLEDLIQEKKLQPSAKCDFLNYATLFPVVIWGLKVSFKNIHILYVSGRRKICVVLSERTVSLW